MNKALAATSPDPLRGAERDVFLRHNPAQSPLLRVQFRRKLEAVASDRGTLDWDSWLEVAQSDSEIVSLMGWDVLDQLHSPRWKQHASASTTTLLSPMEGGHQARNGYVKSSHQQTADDESNGHSSRTRAVLSPSTLSGGDTRRSVSLLSTTMAKKFTVSRALLAGDGALRRNPFEAQFPASDVSASSQTQLHWCQCTVS